MYMRTLLLLILFLFTFNVFSQDVHFSQFSETPLQSNPALAGLFSGDVRMQAVTRTQWQSITVPFQTNSLNAEFKIPVGKGNDFMTFGASILHDQAGTIAMTATNFMPTINFHKSLSDERNLYLSTGFMGGIIQRNLDKSKITTNAQFDGTNYIPGSDNGEPASLAGYTYLDGAAGLSLNGQLTQNENDNFFVGIALHHFNKPSQASFFHNDKVAVLPKWVVDAGIRTAIDEVSFMTFFGEFAKQGPSSEIIGGMLYSYKLEGNEDSKYIIHGGGYLRWNDAIIPVIKLEYKPVTVGLSYDANISELKAYSQGRGGFELSLTFQQYRNRDASSVNATRCPKF